MATRNSASLKLTGFKELEAALLKLPAELAKTVEADALREGMKPVRKASQAIAKGNADTGLLAKSIGLTVRRVRRKLQNVNRYTARVGARTGFRKEVERTSTFKTSSGKVVTRKRKEMADPTKYAHLVEYGTSHSAAKPFIRTALESAESEIIDGLAKGYEKGMEKIVRKIRSRK
jgi:HK97 gp10 family phage protein